MPDIILYRKMYYDSYDNDGFYPQLVPSEKFTYNNNTVILFQLILSNNIHYWIQKSNSVIYGFDGIYGIQLLYSLNKEANVNATKIINCGGRVIYPTSENTTFRLMSNLQNASNYVHVSI